MGRVVSLPYMVNTMKGREMLREIYAMLYISAWEKGFDGYVYDNDLCIKLQTIIVLLKRIKAWDGEGERIYRLGIENGQKGKTPNDFLEYEWDRGRIHELE